MLLLLYYFFLKIRLFTEITGLKLEEGESEAEILHQVQDYERNQEILSGVNDRDEVDKGDRFEYCWEKSQRDENSDLPITPSKPIPGHSKSRSKSSRSPRNSLSRSPGSISNMSKSPKSPKSPSSSSLAGLSNDELQKLKDSLCNEEPDGQIDAASTVDVQKKASVVKFEEDYPPL